MQSTYGDGLAIALTIDGVNNIRAIIVVAPYNVIIVVAPHNHTVSILLPRARVQPMAQDFNRIPAVNTSFSVHNPSSFSVHNLTCRGRPAAYRRCQPFLLAARD